VQFQRVTHERVDVNGHLVSLLAISRSVSAWHGTPG